MNEERKKRKKEYDSAWSKARRAANPDLTREKDRVKNRLRRERLSEYMRAYGRARYARNREKIRAQASARYDENRNGARDKALAYGREKYATRNVMYRVRAAFHAAKLRAKKRGLAFDLVMTDLGLPTCCAVTGFVFDMSRSFRQGNIFVPSLDRIDPTLGYVKGNVRMVCHGYNLAKHTGTDSDVLKLARALVKAFPA